MTFRYASAFQPGLPARPPLKTPTQLGPGSYSLNADTACGGIIRMRETFRPSSMFAERYGGKFAHVGDDDFY